MQWERDMHGEWAITAIGWEPVADDLCMGHSEMEALLTDLEQRVESELRRRLTARGMYDGQRLVETAV